MNKIYTENQIQQIAHELLSNTKSKKLCFYGDMGAGKTTLIKALVKELGGKNIANSPTFGIVNEYNLPNGKVLGHHFDFYRLNDETEALDLGFEDYLYQDNWVFIEWAEKINSFLPEDCQRVTIEVVSPNERRITL